MVNSVDDMAAKSAVAEGVSKPGWRPGWGFVALVLATVGVMAVVNLGPVGPDGWGTDFAAAERAAQAKGRPMLVGFFMKNCPPCRAMDRDVLDESKVKDALNSFVTVKVDIDQQIAVAERFGVSATPTFLVVSPKGEVVGGVAGYQPADEFLDWLKRFD